MEETIFERLSAPFPDEDIEWRAERCGKKEGKFWVLVLAYITNRAIMQRLDEVVGPGSWQDRYTEFGSGAFHCEIGIKIGDEWIWKGDGADRTNIEAVKGGFSSSEKRAAVKWGIGRYLYGLEHSFGNVCEDGKLKAKTKEGEWFNYDPPKLPDWALPNTVVGAVEVITFADFVKELNKPTTLKELRDVMEKHYKAFSKTAPAKQVEDIIKVKDKKKKELEEE